MRICLSLNNFCLIIEWSGPGINQKLIMNSDIFDRLKMFTVNQSAVEEDDIEENTSLKADLGINGADAVEYVVAFGKEFNAHVSNFMAAEYFSPEGGV